MEIDVKLVIYALLVVIGFLVMIIWRLLSLLREFHNDSLMFGGDDDDDDDGDFIPVEPEPPTMDRYFSRN